MVWKVIGSPAAARSRRAWMARCRVAWLRWWAAWMRKRVLSGRIGGLLLAWFFFLERGDDLVEVAGDLPVHLCQARLAAGFGRGGDLQQLLVLLAMLGQELGGGDEHRAGQAGFSELEFALGSGRRRDFSRRGLAAGRGWHGPPCYWRLAASGRTASSFPGSP